MKRLILAATIAAMLPSFAADMPKSGIDIQYIEPATRAQDDFFAHINGVWLKTVEIPADRSNWGTYPKLGEDMQPRLRGIIEDAERQQGPDAQKVSAFYASFMNEQRVEGLGIKPLIAELDRIAALKEAAALPGYIAHAITHRIGTPMHLELHQDAKDSSHYVMDLKQGGLGMPDRDYYLKTDDARLSAMRAAYVAHVAKMLNLTGDAQAAAHAEAVVALETEIARIQWTKVENRDPVKLYNKFEIAELAPEWKEVLDASGVSAKTKTVIVSQPSYFAGLAGLLQKTPMETWRAYFTMRAASSYANFLSKAFVDESFAFNQKALRGVAENQPRWKRGVATVNASLGDLMGKLYVQKYVTPETKRRVEQMVRNMLAAYKQSIDTLDWMSPATKQQAQAKLAKFRYKVAYPDKWKDYSALVVRADDLVGNVHRSREVEFTRDLEKLGKTVDRNEWITSAHTVNAFYNPEQNDITLPSGILQPPFFDPAADDAVNYGAVGTSIGHEISHGFDDEGSQYDGDGNLRNWWSEADGKAFAEKTGRLVAQYGSYSPVPGYHVNGQLTLGENIADNSGLAIAYKAYKISLGGKPSPVIDGLTGEQRVFAGFAQKWRNKAKESAMIVQIKSDPHSPAEFRVNGAMRNQPGFYEAFGVKEGDKMYLPPQDRVIIW